MEKKKFFQRKIPIVCIVLLLGFIGLQFVRPSLNNPPVTGDFTAPPEVKNILNRSCYNCHSNETKLAWFDEIAPAYWLVAEHVKDARKQMNFSQWDSLAKPDQKAKLFEAINQVALGNMAPGSYKAVHPDAKVSDSEMEVLRNYLLTLVNNRPADTALINTAGRQYNAWILHNTPAPTVKPTPNGIDFLPDYKNWKAISTTERFDNGTMRVIFGNDVAIQAIASQHINPWPDGTIFAKVAWDQLKDSSGHISTGAFKQVEFMIKDAAKYKSTEGWGWARWKGMQLLPYGKNELFTTECTRCHQPVKDNDFVFTMPINVIKK